MEHFKHLFAFTLLTVALSFSACTPEDKCASITCSNGQVCIDGTCVGATSNTIVSSNITTDATWTADNIYELGGRITVESGATLTIEAGTVIKGQAGTDVNATALLVARGGKLMANGTVTKPIIFTSVADEISIAEVSAGNFMSPNLDVNTGGLWGGLIVLGNAPISATATSVQIDGVPVSDPNGLYGGTDPADNSGSITYVSIRHGGANIGNGSEINGLTLGAVGTGTTISYVEIVGNQDDGIEIFGGGVDVYNVLILNAGDDAVDIDQSWSGILNNFIVIAGGLTDNCLEIDGPEGTLIASNTVRNGSIQGAPSANLADFRSSARAACSNLYFFGFPDPNAAAAKGSLFLSSGSDLTFANGDLTFTAMQIDTTGSNNPALADIFKNGTDVHATIISSNTIGADKNAFTGWTWAAQAALLTNF